MTDKTKKVLLTPEVEAFIGRTSEVSEMYGIVDQETVRQHAVGIPDPDPRYWDEELAKPRFGGMTAPGTMLYLCHDRRPPWEDDIMREKMAQNPFHDDGGSMRKTVRGGFSDSFRGVLTNTHLHAGDEVEVLQYPKIGDRIFYQEKFVDIQEKRSRDGKPFLLTVRETSYWNQNDEVLLKTRTVGISRE